MQERDDSFAMGNTDALLQVEGLRTYFYTGRGIVKAVNNVSFSLKQGEIIGIAGESGSGKTVIALSILRLVPYPGKIVSGRILYGGEDLIRKPSSEMSNIRGAQIGMIFQDPMSCLNPVFTIGEQISAGILAHRNISNQQAMDEAASMLSAVHIPAPKRRMHAYQHEFSGGMKQRVMIALSLSCSPRLLIADNPTTALDSTIQLQFLNLILEIREKFGMSILYITHEFGIVSKLCDRVAILYAGEIIEIGSVYNVLKDPKHPYTRELIACTPTLGMRNKKIETIRGKHPDLALLQPGCKFAPRCNKSMPGCNDLDLDLFETGTEEESHLVRCLLHK
jgi:oligopeptide/dipeptide ABC transporter ATP-binding protein